MYFKHATHVLYLSFGWHFVRRGQHSKIYPRSTPYKIGKQNLMPRQDIQHKILLIRCLYLSKRKLELLISFFSSRHIL